MHRITKILVAAAAAALCTLCTAALAQKAADYPSRPIHIIVPQAPGGSTDISGRMLGAWLEKRWKQPAVVENKPGAATVIGTEFVAKAPPDGYTLLVNAQNMTYMHLQYKNLSFNAVRDFTPVDIIVGSGYVFIVPAALPVTTFGEFVNYVKANPGKLNWGSPGEPVPEIVELMQNLGIEKNMVSIVYKGGTPAVAAVVANEIQLYNAGAFQAAPLLKDGKIKALAYTGLRRHEMLPSVPTVAETVAPGYDAKFLIAAYSVSGVPREINERLNAEIGEMIKSPDNMARLQNLGYQFFHASLDDTRKDFAAMTKRMEGLAARGLLKPAE